MLALVASQKLSPSCRGAAGRWRRVRGRGSLPPPRVREPHRSRTRCPGRWVRSLDAGRIGARSSVSSTEHIGCRGVMPARSPIQRNGSVQSARARPQVVPRHPVTSPSAFVRQVASTFAPKCSCGQARSGWLHRLPPRVREWAGADRVTQPHSHSSHGQFSPSPSPVSGLVGARHGERDRMGRPGEVIRVMPSPSVSVRRDLALVPRAPDFAGIIERGLVDSGAGKVFAASHVPPLG